MGWASLPALRSRLFTPPTHYHKIHSCEQLISKNVAAEIAQAVCDSVKASLVGQKLPSLTRVKTVVREALERAIVRILTPKRSTDLLREVGG